jgi:hypothetical protein
VAIPPDLPKQIFQTSQTGYQAQLTQQTKILVNDPTLTLEVPSTVSASVSVQCNPQAPLYISAHVGYIYCQGGQAPTALFPITLSFYLRSNLAATFNLIMVPAGGTNILGNNFLTLQGGAVEYGGFQTGTFIPFFTQVYSWTGSAIANVLVQGQAGPMLNFAYLDPNWRQGHAGAGTSQCWNVPAQLFNISADTVVLNATSYNQEAVYPAYWGLGLAVLSV